jgi:hypothetical protein
MEVNRKLHRIWGFLVNVTLFLGIFSFFMGVKSLYLDVLYVAFCLDVTGTTTCVLRVL